jgi:double-strand break repair protein MRE11
MPRKNKDSDADIIRVLISTDNHIGYLEKDPVRGDDTFRAFEEVLALARSNAVDMVLLGGDLFHENKPSRRTLIRTMSILRSHCMGDEPISLAVRSDPGKVNYMHPNYAISLPIFIIHGNHDDPTGAAGADALSAIDYLAEANLVTYFGKSPDSRRITVSPILLQKGATKLALYGFGNIRDDVLHETWANTKQVHWLSPAEEGNPKLDDVKWFNLFVLHQNRAARGTTKAVADTMLPNWLDYVVWGHEHDSIPDLAKTEPPIVQPGSTVATSLSEGESLQKHVILLEVCKGRLKHRPIPLQTIRQFEFGEVSLNDSAHGLSIADSKGIEKFLNKRVEEMIGRQEAEFDAKRYVFESGEGLPIRSGVTYPPAQFYLDHLPRILRQPLVRLRVEYSGGFEAMNPQRFGQSYVGRSACATEILLFFKRRPKVLTKPFLRGRIGASGVNGQDDYGTNEGHGEDRDHAKQFSQDNGGLDIEDDTNGMQIPSLVEYFLYHKEAGGTGLKFLELDKLATAVDEFVAKSENRAIPDYVVSYLKLQQESTLDKLERKGSIMTDDELTAGFQEHAQNAAARAFIERAKSSQGPVAAELSQLNGRADQIHGRKSNDKNLTPGDSYVAASIGDDPSARLENVHLLLTSNPRTAAVAKAARNAARRDAENEHLTTSRRSDDAVAGDDSDEDEDEGNAVGIAENGNPESKVLRLPPKPPGRGRGRGRGGRAAPLAGSRKPPAATPPAPSRPRSSGRKPRSAAPSSFVVDENENEDEEDDEIVDSEEEAEVVPKSRKRKAPASSVNVGGRPTSRARTSGRAATGSGFAARGRLRNPAPTIDLDDDSE